MEGTTSTGMYPLHRCKILHLVRHAQGIHNVAGEKDFGSYLSNDYLDAHLTDLGWSQVDNLRMHVQRTGLVKKIELVITSPLLRTMQTAIGVFGGEECTDGINAPPLMIQNAFNSGRPAVSCLGAPPFLAVESCREHMGEHSFDKRRSVTEYRPAFPAIDFSLIENDEDVLWMPGVEEKIEVVTARAAKFINWTAILSFNRRSPRSLPTVSSGPWSWSTEAFRNGHTTLQRLLKNKGLDFSRRSSVKSILYIYI